MPSRTATACGGLVDRRSACRPRLAEPSRSREGIAMVRFEIGIVLPIMQFGPDRFTPRWPAIRAMALRAEEIGFDTIWTPDELLWQSAEGPPRGVWDGVSMAGAVAAVTDRAAVGTW